MTDNPEQMIAEQASDIKSEKELKTLIFHQDYVYLNFIRPELDFLETSGKKKVVDHFNHYYNVNRKIIAYLWQELQLAKNPKLKEVFE